ncbi:hypothetical protein POM88_041445 [Heracleum sosnowskyi]|uniref:HMA domain-containing protein n=1 Tax=Heracleum sosnowskyi TaxID=360622 RepID=A0AAD8MAS1_9APIA|nr:hypothetical protein POM88_041445 [Heracleum sosnowskyi]
MLMLILVIHVFVKDNKLRAYFNRFQVKLKRNVAEFAAVFRANSKELQTQANGDGKPATGAKTTGTEVQNELVENKSQNKIENVDWEDVFLLSDDAIESEWPLETPEFSIHCDGCKHKVKKLLQKIEGWHPSASRLDWSFHDVGILHIS